MGNPGAVWIFGPDDPGTRESVRRDWMIVCCEAYGVTAVIVDQGGVHSFHESGVGSGNRSQI